MKNEDPSVIAYRLDRIRRAPANWTGWVAAFTAFNGFMVASEQDFLFLVGAVSPFLAPGPTFHFAAAALLAACAYFGRTHRAVLVPALVLYVLDMGLAVHVGVWSGVVMHGVVLGLVGLSLVARKGLAAQLAAARVTPATS